MIHCFECGHKEADNMVYCTMCGHKLGAPNAETAVLSNRELTDGDAADLDTERYTIDVDTAENADPSTQPDQNYEVREKPSDFGRIAGIAILLVTITGSIAILIAAFSGGPRPEGGSPKSINPTAPNVTVSTANAYNSNALGGVTNVVSNISPATKAANAQNKPSSRASTGSIGNRPVNNWENDPEYVSPQFVRSTNSATYQCPPGYHLGYRANSNAPMCRKVR